MDIRSIILGVGALFLQLNTVMAQPCSYQATSQWPPLLCQPTHEQYAPIPQIQRGWETYYPNHGLTTPRTALTVMAVLVFNNRAHRNRSIRDTSLATTVGTMSCTERRHRGLWELAGGPTIVSECFVRGFHGGLELIWIRPNFDQMWP